MQGLYHRDTFRLTELSREEATATLKEVVPYISASIWRVELNSHHVFRLNSLTCTCTPHKTRRGDVISLRAVAGHFRGLLQQEGEAVGRRARIEVIYVGQSGGPYLFRGEIGPVHVQQMFILRRSHTHLPDRWRS